MCFIQRHFMHTNTSHTWTTEVSTRFGGKASEIHSNTGARACLDYYITRRAIVVQHTSSANFMYEETHISSISTLTMVPSPSDYAMGHHMGGWSNITHLDCMCCIYCDLVIGLITVRQPQIIVLRLQVKVWEDQLQHNATWRRSDR